MVTTISGSAFLKRFCLHILPPGFTRIRHYGFLFFAAKTKTLAALREYFCLDVHSDVNSSWQTITRVHVGIEAQCCNKCGHTMQIVRIIPDRFHRPIRALAFTD